MSTDEMVAWLRATVLGDRAAAEAATSGPWVYHRETDGVVLPSARTVPELREIISTPREPADARHIALHDPQDIIADCSSKLAIIDGLLAEKHHVSEDCWYTCAAATEEREGETTCREDLDGECDCGRDARVDRYLRLLAFAYRHRPGWQEHWRPA